ncbi:hypothetical protein DDE18_04130 [Nocardioides gansuensis]|uniref:Uncharacterized protein n=1 Tax=Nocardioides gansuensis TaxID=2138300 RepID=A0A2T8FGD5_9ACTN|nr:hypothetical protein [Nocardioides gansuensis]PVG84788.1 hypothetical protein DDE18_04130 [Nocardioides gansuensis]
MSFSIAEFQAAVDKINQGMDDISTKMQEIAPAANAAIDHWYIPDFIAEGIIWLAEKTIELAQKIWDKIVEVIKGIAAPVYFFQYSQQLNDVASSADSIEANLADQLLIQADEWSGQAADAYKAEVPPQRNAAGELGTIAEAMKSSLIWAAVAGLAFYVGLGVIIVKFIAAMVAAIAAFGSAVFSWAGAALIVEEAGVNIAAIAALVTTLLALLGDQVKEMGSLQNAASSDKFPYGKWPVAAG